MMQVANYVRIVGNGACEAVFNGEVQREIERQNEAHRREMEGAAAMRKVTETSRNRMLAEKLAAIREKKRPSMGARVRERAAIIWATLWAWMLEIGLIREERP